MARFPSVSLVSAGVRVVELLVLSLWPGWEFKASSGRIMPDEAAGWLSSIAHVGSRFECAILDSSLWSDGKMLTVTALNVGPNASTEPSVTVYVGPQFVPIGQQDLEQTPLPLSALNHARSFDENSRAGSVVRRIDRGNAE